VTYNRVAWENSGTPVTAANLSDLRTLVPEQQQRRRVPWQPTPILRPQSMPPA